MWAWRSSGKRQETERFRGSTGGEPWWAAAGFSLQGKGGGGPVFRSRLGREGASSRRPELQEAMGT